MKIKLLTCICLGLIVFNINAEYPDAEDSPDVYIDISKKALQDSKKLDGWKILGGLGYSMSNFSSTLRGGCASSSNNINHFVLSLGVDYTKKIKQQFVWGGNFIIDIWKAGKKTGDWQVINRDYYDREWDKYAAYGTMDGEIKTPCITPELALKGGYIFRNFDSIVSLKVGLQYMKAEYSYSSSGLPVDSFTATKLIAFVGIGSYKRLTKNWGVSFELNFPFKGEYSKQLRSYCHKVDMGRRTIRMLATYAIPSN